MPKCRNCGEEFPARMEIEGRVWNLASRRFCPTCSPLGRHNRRKYIVTTESGKAFCACCQQDKDCGEFHKRKGSSKPLSYCKACSEAIKTLKFEEKIERMVMLKGGVCADCGQTFPVPLFEFRNDDGVFPISTAKNMSWERLTTILENHVMLCRNCSALRDWERG